MLSDYQDKLKCIITEDEIWIYAYDPETTDQSSENRGKGEARPKRARQSRSKIKVMMTVFSIFVVWCTLNSCHLAKLLIRNIIQALCVVYVNQFV